MDNPQKLEKENIKLDASLAKVARQLKGRYENRRNINLPLLKVLPSWLRVSFAVVQVVCCIILVLSSLACIASSNAKSSNLSPNMYGYTCVEVKENIGEEGLNRGRTAIFHSVNAESLKSGDIIAYYVYGITYYDVNIDDLSQATDFEERNYTFALASVLGHQSDIITQAARENCVLVTHHVKDVYVDDAGVRYFLTYGSNVDFDDLAGSSYLVREDMIVGVYDSSFMARVNTMFIRAMQNPAGMLLLFVPLLLVVAYIVYINLHDAQLLAVQRDVIEEKRHLTDPLFVDYSVGFDMDEIDKYKILAQLDANVSLEHLSLLWQDVSDAKLKEYLVKAQFLFPPIQQMLKVHRECEKMLNSGEEEETLATFYIEGRQKYQKELALAQQNCKAFYKKYQQGAVDDEYLQIEKAVEDWIDIIKKQSLHNKNEKLPNAKTESKSADNINNVEKDIIIKKNVKKGNER